MPDDISINNALTGSKRLEALKGLDWNCKYCNSIQNSLGPVCGECGCKRDSGAKAYVDETIVATLDTETGERTETRHEEVVKPAVSVPAWTERDAEPKYEPPKPPRRAPKPPPPPTPLPPPPTTFSPLISAEELQRSLRGPQWPLFLVGLLGIALLILGLWAIFRTRIVQAHVSAVCWEHKVSVDRYQLWVNEGWDPPAGAIDPHVDRKKIHHYDHVKSGFHYEERWSAPYDCHCKTVPGECHKTKVTCMKEAGKKGVAKCTGGDNICSPDTKSCDRCKDPLPPEKVDDYKDVPVWRDWYSWKVWDWGYNRTVPHSGNTLETSWPSEQELSVTLAPGEQERHRREAPIYKVTFTDTDNDVYTIAPGSEEQFKLYPIGLRCTLKVGVANGVVVLSRGGQ
jgi:hypothetical protein